MCRHRPLTHQWRLALFFATVLTPLAVSASEGINMLWKAPRTLRSRMLQENVQASDLRRGRPRRGAHDLLACLVVNHLHPRAFCDALRIRRHEATAAANVVMFAIVNVTTVVVIAAI